MQLGKFDLKIIRSKRVSYSTTIAWQSQDWLLLIHGPIFDVPPYGVRRQSGAATALLLIQSRPLARSGLALRSPAHSIYFAMHALGGTARMHPSSMSVEYPMIEFCEIRH